MPNYYVNKDPQDNGDHEVHLDGCAWLPSLDNRLYLGEYLSCHDAVETAQALYAQVNGCCHCSNDCHTG